MKRTMLAAVAVGGLAAPVARAQTEPAPDAPQPAAAGSMEVAAHLWGVIARYRYAATADRVRVTLIRPGGGSDMLSLVVRCVPGASGLARLELGDLTVVARDGRLLATHDRDPTTYAELVGPDGSDPASVLRALLPPLAIPQLSLAFDPGEVDWCPWVRGVAWESAERVSLDGHDGVRLTGRSDVGRASIELAGARVRRFEADLNADGQTRLIVECEPLEPGDPAGWGLDVSSRRRVSGLAALQPLGQRVGVGDRIPVLRATLVGRQQEIVIGQESQPALFPETRYYALLLLRDDTPVGVTRAVAESVLRGVTEFQRELLRARLDGRLDKRVRLAETRAVVQAEPTGGLLERIAMQSGAWLAALEAARPDGADRPELAWSGSEGRLIDRLSPGARGVVLLYDGTGVIRALRPVDEHATPASVGSALTAGVVTLDRSSN